MDSKRASLHLIAQYKDYPRPWRVKSDDYHNKPMKIAAMASLVEEMRHFDTDVTSEDVKRKLFPRRTRKKSILKRRGEGHVGLEGWRLKSFHTCLSYMLVKHV